LAENARLNAENADLAIVAEESAATGKRTRRFKDVAYPRRVLFAMAPTFSASAPPRGGTSVVGVAIQKKAII